MQSIREQILQAISTRLEPVAAGQGAGFWRAPTIALTRDLAPALLLFPESDAVARRINDRVERQLSIRLVAVVRDAGDQRPELLADHLLVEAHAALMVERTLGGIALGIQEIDTDWDIEDADGGAAAMPVRYQVAYRTMVGSLADCG
jgi:hypothetical protein